MIILVGVLAIRWVYPASLLLSLGDRRPRRSAADLALSSHDRYLLNKPMRQGACKNVIKKKPGHKDRAFSLELRG